MIQDKSETKYNLLYRLLRLFADIRPGEAPKASLLALNSFLLLMAYYILKPLRDALLLVDKNSPVVKSYLGGAQAILFIFVIKGFCPGRRYYTRLGGLDRNTTPIGSNREIRPYQCRRRGDLDRDLFPDHKGVQEIKGQAA
jgi:hypothetical protein